MVAPSDDPVLQEAVALFTEAFKSDPEKAAFAPGRVNLIGEHTDYNAGFVFPLALEFRTFVVGRGCLLPKPLNSNTPWFPSKVVSKKFDKGGVHEVVSFVANDQLIPSEPVWANYVKGVVAEYIQSQGPDGKRHIPEGKYLCFEAAICSSVPLGSGLSSSAALEVSVATFLEQIIGSAPSKKKKALMCQHAEHKFANMPCGIMDQFISAMGKQGHILLIDCRDQKEELVPFSSPNIVVFVTNSHVKHILSGSEYPTRVAQCNEAVKAIRAKFPNVTALRDATMDMLDKVKGDLPEVVYRRARHVITENDRTVGAVADLKKKNFKDVGRLMYESHVSLRDDYEVSCEELDFLVDVAMKVPGVLGSRMTGGGFGGCTVTLVEEWAVKDLEKALKENYKKVKGMVCDTFVTTPGEGAGVVKLSSGYLDCKGLTGWQKVVLYVSLGLAGVAVVAGGVYLYKERGGASARKSRR